MEKLLKELRQSCDENIRMNVEIVIIFGMFLVCLGMVLLIIKKEAIIAVPIIIGLTLATKGFECLPKLKEEQ